MSDIIFTPERHCPACGHTLDAMTASKRETARDPLAGDYALCFGCGTPLVITPKFNYRIMSNLDWGQLHSEDLELFRHLKKLIAHHKNTFGKKR